MPLPTTPATTRKSWQVQLQNWAADGSLASAARYALELGEDDPPQLIELVSQWAAGDFSGLPPIVLLPASSMPGAAGAYAISTGTIYLNEDWLKTASDERVIAVLTEELGHHLDGLLNEEDTEDDEGAKFAKILLSRNSTFLTSDLENNRRDDETLIVVDSMPIEAEAASTASYWGFSLPDNITQIDIEITDDDFLIVSGIERYPGQSDGRYFIAKYTYNGLLEWNQYLGETAINRDNSNKIHLDESGTVFYANTFSGQIILEGQNLTSYYDDSVILRVDRKGTLSLVKHISGGMSDTIRAAEVLDDGSMIIAGSSDWRALGNANENSRWSGTFLAKIGSDGTTQWVKPLNGTLTIKSVEKASNGLLLTGNFSGEITLNGTTLTSSNDGLDILTVLMNESGEII